MTTGSAKHGALVLSLDFELLWGIRDHVVRSPVAAHRRLRGAREVVPRLLEMFEQFQISATWATVGALFAGSREELEHFAPALRPAYAEPSLSAYGEAVGRSEHEDPLRLAKSLVRLIADAKGQEVATHTFSHYYCGEEGQSIDAFRADLEAAIAIAAREGIRLRSIVFPRNQHNAAYDPVLLENKIFAFRGNPDSMMWRFSNHHESSSLWRRAARLLDSYAGRQEAGTYGWTEVLEPTGLANVRASSMLIPYRPALRRLERGRLARIRRSLRFAARERRIYHLWWHPHNFGEHQEENLNFLREVLTEFAQCRELHGMESLSMTEVGMRVRKFAADRMLPEQGVV